MQNDLESIMKLVKDCARQLTNTKVQVKIMAQKGNDITIFRVFYEKPLDYPIINDATNTIKTTTTANFDIALK